MKQFILLLIFISLAANSYARQSIAPPNIILIVADNLNLSLLGPYGNKEIRTPHLDSLASAGMTFRHAYAVSGVCSPTRATLLSGLIPSQTGVHNALPSEFAIQNWSAIAEFRNLPQTLARAGYRTGLVGKYHLGQPDQAQLGFDYWVTFPSGHTTGFYGETIIDNGKVYREESMHLTDFWTNKAIEFIDETDRRPFFLYLAYNGPYNLAPLVLQALENRHAAYYLKHTPAMPQEPIHDYLKAFVMEAANEGGELLSGWRIDKNDGGKPLATTTRWLDLSWATVRALNNKKAMANVASETAMIDDGVGKILNRLKTQGLDKNTIVIFTSDQSAAYGQHGLWGNSSQSSPTAAYDENMRVPFIIKHPQGIAAASETDIMINQFDVFPTLLDYIGLGELSIAGTPGRSFVKTLLSKEEADWQDEVYFEYILTRAVRTKYWKYIKRFLTSPDELYDLENDPGETQNLITSPKHHNIISILDKKLTRFFDRYADPQFDVWHGGTAKAVLMYGDRNHMFEQHFADWSKPFVRQSKAFTH